MVDIQDDTTLSDNTPPSENSSPPTDTNVTEANFSPITTEQNGAGVASPQTNEKPEEYAHTVHFADVAHIAIEMDDDSEPVANETKQKPPPLAEISTMSRSTTIEALSDASKVNQETMTTVPPMLGVEPTIMLPSQRQTLLERKMTVRLGKGQREWRTFLDVNIGPDKTYEAVERKKREKPTFKEKCKDWFDYYTKKKKPRTSRVPYNLMSAEEQRDVRVFIIDFAYAMSIYGIPSHRLEHNLMVVSNYYCVQGNYFSTPTGIWFNFGNILEIDEEGGSSNSFSSFVRINGADLNLGKFMELDRLAYEISSGTLETVIEAKKRIKEIIRGKQIFTHWFWTILVTAAFAPIFAVLLDGTWGEIVAALIGGFLVSFILILQARFPILARMATGLCAFGCGLVGIIFKFAFFSTQVRMNVPLIALSGVVMCLPGLSLTTAIDELSVGHLASGTSRLVNVGVTVVKIGFGLLLTERLDNELDSSAVAYAYKQDTTDYVRVPNAVWIKAITLPPMIAIILIYFKVPRLVTSYLFVIIACTAAFFGDIYWNMIMSTEIAGVLNAFIIGFIGNVYSFVSRRPSNIVTTCAILLLVPGYASANSINQLLSNNPSQFVTTLFNAIIAAASLVTGLAASEILFPKKRGQLSY